MQTRWCTASSTTTPYIYSWKERQQQLYLAPQVMLLSVIPIGQVGLTIEAGVEYAFCLQSSYCGAGDIEHMGYYPKWGLTLYDVAAHGFYRTTDFAPNGLLEEQFSNRQPRYCGQNRGADSTHRTP